MSDRKKESAMIWKIAKKEFFLNLVSARFVIGFLLCLFLIPFIVTVSIDDYDNRIRVYRVDKANAENSLKYVRGCPPEKPYPDGKLKPRLMKFLMCRPCQFRRVDSEEAFCTTGWGIGRQS